MPVHALLAIFLLMYNIDLVFFFFVSMGRLRVYSIPVQVCSCVPEEVYKWFLDCNDVVFFWLASM
jgi:hypothetical protein